ncbi:MAG: hypothetical protein ABSG91_08065 [Syntrophobacteraceae bacterium]
MERRVFLDICLEQFVPTLQRAIEETRSIYMGLRPSMLDSVGLLSTLEWRRRECMKLYPDRHVELETGIAEDDRHANNCGVVCPETVKSGLIGVLLAHLGGIWDN